MCHRLFTGWSWLLLLVGVLSSAGAAGQAPEPPKPTEVPARPEREPATIRLSDGTFLWLGRPSGSMGERVTLTPQEYQKLVDELDRLRKQLTARKTLPPSRCAVRGRVEKQGDQPVAVLQLTYTFRTTVPQAGVSLGGRRGFLVSATLDGQPTPILDTTEEGFVLTVEKPGDHTAVLELQVPITTRGSKPELGFEIGLPRAPITTLQFDPPGPEVKRVNLTTRTPDPTKPGSGETRRLAVDLRQLVSRPGAEDGLAVGPVDSLEVTWDPPAAAQVGEQVRSAELDLVVLMTEGVIETTAKIRLRGTGREWQIVTPAKAELSVDRSPGMEGGVGPSLSAVVTRPSDANAPVWVWKVELPTGTSAGDWVVTVVSRQLRPLSAEPNHRGPFAIGPLQVLNVLRQTGSVRVTAAGNQRFAFRHGPELRRAEVLPPADDDTTTAVFRLATGPTAARSRSDPLLTVESWPLPGRVAVQPAHRLTLRAEGWQVRTEAKFVPIRTEVEAVTVEVPAEWRGLEASPPELVVGVQAGPLPEAFWARTATVLGAGNRIPVLVRLAGPQKAPFELVLTATVPAEATEGRAGLGLPRFVGALERDTSALVTVPDGVEVRGEFQGWGGETASWGIPLTATPGADGKPPRVVSALIARNETGLARLRLAWNPHRPDLRAELRAAVTFRDRQLDVTQVVKLRSAEPLPRPVRFRGPSGVAGLQTSPLLQPVGPDEWLLTPPADSRELTLRLRYALPRPDDGTEVARLPVPLFYPTPVTQTEAAVSVWPGTATDRTFRTSSAGWRELPPEADPERGAFPALTVGASGDLPPLVLEAVATGFGGTVAVWVERGLIQAWTSDEGTTRYRARFLLRRWLPPFVEVRLPGPLAGSTPEFYRDGQRITPAVRPTGSEADRRFRIPLPEPRSGLGAAVEVRYELPTPPAGEAVYEPPTLAGAAFVGPVRWRVRFPSDTVPLLTAGGQAEFRWWPRLTGVWPSPVGNEEADERWFRSGEEPGGPDRVVGDGESLAAYQATPASLRVYRTRQVGLLIASSAGVFVLILVVTRLPVEVSGPVVAVVAGLIGLAAVLLPHATAQVVGACQPGVLAAGLVLLAHTAARWLYQRKLSRLPTFARSAADGSAPSDLPAGRPRPAGVGSSGPVGPTPTVTSTPTGG